MMAYGTASLDGHPKTNAALRADDHMRFYEDAMIHFQAAGYISCRMDDIGIACFIQSGGSKEGIKHRGLVVGHGQTEDHRLRFIRHGTKGHNGIGDFLCRDGRSEIKGNVVIQIHVVGDTRFGQHFRDGTNKIFADAKYLY